MKKVFEHNGYHGSAEISMEDGCLFGEILFINDLVLYQADTVENLEHEFRLAVDDYIKTCKEVGKEPDKPFKGSFNVRVSSDLHRKASVNAVKEDITLNELVGKALEYYLDKPDRANNITHNDHHHHYSSSGLPPGIFDTTFGNIEEGQQWQISPSILSH